MRMSYLRKKPKNLFGRHKRQLSDTEEEMPSKRPKAVKRKRSSSRKVNRKSKKNTKPKKKSVKRRRRRKTGDIFSK